jgi:hypothetical protein
MNNEPVAWMLVDASWNDFCRYSSYPSEGAIPLYTHPVKEELDTRSYLIGRYDSVKEITDEEIEELSEQHLDWNWQTGDIEFARAILRKAQEK